MELEFQHLLQVALVERGLVVQLVLAQQALRVILEAQVMVVQVDHRMEAHNLVELVVFLLAQRRQDLARLV